MDAERDARARQLIASRDLSRLLRTDMHRMHGLAHRLREIGLTFESGLLAAFLARLAPLIVGVDRASREIEAIEDPEDTGAFRP